MKRTTTILAALALLPLGLLAPAAVHANEVDDEVIAYEVDWDVPTARWVDADGYIRLPQAELEALALTQTAADIQTLVDSGEPLNTLIDPTTGDYIAAAVAVKAKPSMITPNAVVSAGCGTWGVTNVGRTVGGRGVANCFSGRGVLWVSLPNTYYVSAGDSDVYLVWTGGGGGTTVWAGWSGVLPSGPANYQQIQRSAP